MSRPWPDARCVGRRRYPTSAPRTLGAEELAGYRLPGQRAAETHALSAHGWGIVRGLDLRGEDSSVLLRPGLAVDGYGRRLVVPRPARLRFGGGSSGDAATRRLDVWLLAALARPSSPGARAGMADRERETVVLRVTTAGEGAIDPSDPAAWPAMTGSASGPEPVESRWPIYLGRVEGGPEGWLSLAARRRFAPLAGGRWIGPAGPQLEILPASHGARAVVLRRLDEAVLRDPPEVRCQALEDEICRREWLVIEEKGGVVAGDLVVAGDVGLVQSRVSWLAETPAPLRPGWRVFRPAKAAGTPAELRVEMPAAAGEGQEMGGWRVGTELGNGFAGLLQVTPDGRVRIPGDLILRGEYRQPEVAVDPSDPRFRSQAIRAYYQGMAFSMLRAAPTLSLEPGIEPAGPGGSLVILEAVNTGVLAMEVTLSLEIAGSEEVLGAAELAPGEEIAFERDLPAGEVRLVAEGRVEGYRVEAETSATIPISGDRNDG